MATLSIVRASKINTSLLDKERIRKTAESTVAYIVSNPEASAVETLRKARQAGKLVVVIEDADGQIVGLITIPQLEHEVATHTDVAAVEPDERDDIEMPDEAADEDEDDFAVEDVDGDDGGGTDIGLQRAGRRDRLFRKSFGAPAFVLFWCETGQHYIDSLPCSAHS